MSSLILRTLSGFLVGLLAVLSVFMLLRGHDHPGGGFVGGLLFAAALAIRMLSHGPAAARTMLRVDPRGVAGAGLLCAALAACAGPIAGRPLLSPLVATKLAVIGELGTVLLFDVGVYLVVAGTALSLLLTLDEEED